jgi:hypothetical protein
LLKSEGLLHKFDYLSTVSGGGYIGGWLSAWIADKNLKTAVEGLNKDLRESREDKRDPESEPIRHLRRYSNYLTPQLGVTSADTWTLIATVIRNVFLNWLMLIPLMAAALMLPRLFAGLAISQSRHATNCVIWAVVIAGLVCTLIATAYSTADLPKWRTDRVAKITSGRFVLLCVIPLMASAWLISLGWFWLSANFLGSAEQLSEWAIKRGTKWMLWPPGAWSFIVGLWAASFLGGLIGGVATGKLTFSNSIKKYRESAGVLATAAAGGVGLWWVLTWLFEGLFPYTNDAVRLNFLCFAPSLVLLIFLLMNFLFVGTLSYVTTSEDREWWARSSGWILVAAVVWALLSAVSVWGPVGVMALIQSDYTWVKTIVAAIGGLSGIVTALVGHSTSTTGPKQQSNSKSGLWLTIGALLFIIFLLVCVSFGTSWVLAKLSGVGTDIPQHKPGTLLDFRAYYPTTVLSYPTCHLFWLFVGLAGCGWLVGWLINVNQFSLHAMYRARLIRAFLGASRGAARKPHWFTGFDPKDNIDMHQLATQPPRKLFHVVNTAMNLVSGKDLAWQERMAQSFTISPLHSGSWLTGYRPSKKFALGIGLGTAITISGAAASPNMGYHSSPLVTFLMTLFNVRLGWWVANPGTPGNRYWQKAGPQHAAWPLICEAFGYTTSDFTYVNLSDGGHFENLGLYEMILRRCRHIVVVDAGHDTDYAFEDLGNAIRKIRIDFGIDIEIKINFIAPDKDKTHLARCAVGQIRYDRVDEAAPIGELIYIKPVLRKGEPVDVYNYHKAHPEFPHESTNDQWFSESQLESYRMLGFYTIREMCEGAGNLTELEDFFTHIKTSTAKLDTISVGASSSAASGAGKE